MVEDPVTPGRPRGIAQLAQIVGDLGQPRTVGVTLPDLAVPPLLSLLLGGIREEGHPLAVRRPRGRQVPTARALQVRRELRRRRIRGPEGPQMGDASAVVPDMVGKEPAIGRPARWRVFAFAEITAPVATGRLLGLPAGEIVHADTGLALLLVLSGEDISDLGPIRRPAADHGPADPTDRLRLASIGPHQPELSVCLADFLVEDDPIAHRREAAPPLGVGLAVLSEPARGRLLRGLLGPPRRGEHPGPDETERKQRQSSE